MLRIYVQDVRTVGARVRAPPPRYRQRLDGSSASEHSLFSIRSISIDRFENLPNLSSLGELIRGRVSLQA